MQGLIDVLVLRRLNIRWSKLPILTLLDVDVLSVLRLSAT